MLDRIKLVWRYRRQVIPLIESAEHLTDVALLARPKHLELIHTLDSTFFDNALIIMALHDRGRAEMVIRKMHNINETWDQTGKSDTETLKG